MGIISIIRKENNFTLDSLPPNPTEVQTNTHIYSLPQENVSFFFFFFLLRICLGQQHCFLYLLLELEYISILLLKLNDSCNQVYAYAENYICYLRVQS